MAETVKLSGKRYVILEESEYRRLLSNHGVREPSLPPLPPANAQGRYPAAETLRTIMARKIIRRRRALGLSQSELARLAGVRPETLSRIEHAKHTPSLNTVQKIDDALSRAKTQRKR